MKLSLIALLSLATYSLAGLSADNSKVPGFKLQLAEETYLTDLNGLVSPEQVSRVELGRRVRIYRTDGFCYIGRVTSIEESESAYKVYGKVDNVVETHFGFVLAKGGIFAGAVIEISNSKTYVVELSEAHKGFVLQLSSKYDKPSA
jgi:hypothetical protein